MKRALIAMLLFCFHAHSQTSNVAVVKAWQRTHVIGLPGGTLLDPTGTMADGQRLAAVQASADASTGLVSAAAAGLTNALQRLYAETNRLSSYTGRLYLAADMDPDPAWSNVEAYIVAEYVSTNGSLHYLVHYNRELAAPPKTVWSFTLSPGAVYWSPGTVSTNNATTNVLGFACYDISVQRPSAAGNAVLRTHRFLRFGAPGYPLAIPDAGLSLVCGASTNLPFTGSVAVTNEAQTVAVTETYLSGFLYTVTTNAVGGTP